MTTGHGGSRLTGARPAPAPRLPDDVVTPEQRRALAEQRARRAVRARRRFALTLVLLLASVAAAVAVVVVPLHWGVAAVPAVLLVTVLALGRRAAVAARRAEQAVETARREARQRATQARALANGGPYAPRNRLRVNGAAEQAGGAPAEGGPAEGGELVPAAKKSGGVLDEILTVPEPARAKVVDETGAPAAEPAAERPEAATGVGGGAWEPVPVPLPTYVTKPPARRLPARAAEVVNGAGADAGAAGQAAGPGRAGGAGQPAGRSAGQASVQPAGGPAGDRPVDDKAARLAAAVRASAGIPTGETPAVPAAAAADHQVPGHASAAGEPAPSSSDTTMHPDEEELMRPAPRVREETLAQPLEQILARRRAAG